MKKILPLFLMIGLCSYLSGQGLESGIEGTLINLTPDGVSIKNEVPGSGDEGKKLMVLGTKLIFIGEDATNGQELWITDGTPEGTMLIKDINPGSASSNPTNIEVVDTKAYFAATNTSSGTELWVTDGTSEGTMIVKDLYPGPSGSTPQMITSFKGGVLFRAMDIISEAYGQSWLYWSDGSTVSLISETQPRSAGDSKYKFIQVTHNGEKAFYVGENKVYGNEMWVTDGTEEGTNMVLDIGIDPDPDNPNEGATKSSKIEWHFAVNDEQVLFRAETPAWWLEELDGTGLTSIGEEIWVTNGTAEGTYLLGDFNTALEDDVTRTQGTAYAFPFLYMDQVWFRADDGIHYVELCKSSDLSVGSVENVLNTNGPAPDGSGDWPTWVEQMVLWDGLFYFFINSGSATEQWPVVTGHEMAVYDGANDTVYCLYDAWGEDDGLQHPWKQGKPLVVNRRMYFAGNADQASADRAVYFIEEKSVDPTHTPVKMFNNPGDQTSYIFKMANNMLYIVTKDGDVSELFLYDDGRVKDPITDNKATGPAVSISPGNRLTNENTTVNNRQVLSMKLFPNPAGDYLTVQMNRDRADAQILNSVGQSVWSGTVKNNGQISLQSFEAGSHILRIKTDEGVVHKLFVILK
jgi:ELWxxDGT repeat protein